MASPRLQLSDPASQTPDFLNLEPSAEELFVVNEALGRIRAASLRYHERQLWKLRMKDALIVGLTALVVTWPLATLLFAGVR